jgi:hypothetical protein
VDSGVAPTWFAAWQLCSTDVSPRSEGSNKNQNYAFAGTVQDQQRIQKLLESANIKLASIVTHTMGKSGQAILDAIVSGEDSSEELADLALGKLRSKIPQLQLALDGRIRDHHRFLLGSLLREYRFLEAEIQALDARLQHLGAQHQELADAVERWITVPGVERVAAWTLVAEIGPDMTAFPSAAHLASWAGLCPGNHESARQTAQRQKPKWQSMVAPYGVSVCVGSSENEELLPLHPVQTTRGS